VRARLLPLADAPATILALLAVVVLAIWAGTEGGYPTHHWYPGAVFLLAVLATAAVLLPGRLADVPRPALLAGACLLGFTLWSFASIAWADHRGQAWDGANRTLLYLVVFALFALWPQRGEAAAAILGAWTLAIAGIALGALLALAMSEDPTALLIADRLAEPAGYANAAAATALMALFPAIVLAGRPEVPWWLRGVFAGGAVVIVAVATLSLSRGAIFSLPLLLVLFFVAVPGRVRSFCVLVALAPAVAATLPSVLDVGRDLRAGRPPLDAVANVAPPVILVAALVALLVAAAARFESTRRLAPEAARRLHRGLAVAGLATAGLVVVVTIALTGSPVANAREGWQSFKRGQPVTDTTSRSRLARGLGSNRYDAYRVALNSFADHPLTGVGADNFAQDYLRHGRSDEMLRYPHSLQMRTLGQTGLVGALLLLGVVGGIGAAALAATRRDDPLGAAVAGGAGMVFAYWLVHGSFDWFWEFAGLGAAAFAMAGLACALAPRRPAAPGDGHDARVPVVRGPAAIAAGVGAVLAAATLAVPWLAERDVQRAARGWPADPGRAFERLDRAEGLNRLSDRPALVAGSIALRVGDLERAERAFARAHERNSRGVYAVLELGALASQRGDRDRAERLLAEAGRLAPRDRIIRAALSRVRTGKRLDVNRLNREILTRAAKLVR